MNQMPNLFSGRTQDDPEPSSLDRFIRENAKRLLPLVNNGMTLGFGIAATIQLALGGIFGIAAITTQKAGLNFPAWIMLTLGTSFAVAALISHLTRSKGITNFKLSADATKLVMQLASHLGWATPESNRLQQYRRRTMFLGDLFMPPVKTTSQILPKEAFELLDAAAAQYNRLKGLLELAKNSQGRPSKFEPTIREAAEETMVTIINQVALVESTPESLGAIRSQVMNRVQQLSELANRLEMMMADPGTSLERMASATRLDSVLEDLRLEQVALEEIRFTPEDSEIRKNLEH